MAARSDETQRPERRERRDAAENRRQILAAARQLFAEHGIDQTSMNEIARAAGVGVGTLYRRYAHKGQLCEALLMDDLQAFRARVERALAQRQASEPALELLGWLIDELLAMVERHVPLLAAIQDAAVGPRRTEIFEQPFYRWLHEQLAALLGRALAAGEAGDLQVDVVADAIQAATAPPLFVFQKEQRGLSREQIGAALRRLFVDGLRAAPGA